MSNDARDYLWTKWIIEELAGLMGEPWDLAKNGRAWENPDWCRAADRSRESAEAAGYNRLDGWVWSWWGWDESSAGPVGGG